MALSRHPPRTSGPDPASVPFTSVDLVSGEGLRGALREVSLAYYLVHSMGPGPGTNAFADRDRAAAENFVREAEREGVERIVFLGGLGGEGRESSVHLRSRSEVARILGQGGPDLTVLSAAIVVGRGGWSFEMIHQLVARLPVMVCPRWIDRYAQPIALRDLVDYLVRIPVAPATARRSFDVGGPERWRYADLLLRVGDHIGRRPWLVVVPVLTPALSAHWVGLITDVPTGLARPVVDSMTASAVCREETIRTVLPGPLLTLDRALEEALGPSRSRGPRPHRAPGPIAGDHELRLGVGPVPPPPPPPG